MAYSDDKSAWQDEYLNALADALLEIAKSGMPLSIKKGDTYVRFTSSADIRKEMNQIEMSKLYADGCVERKC